MRLLAILALTSALLLTKSQQQQRQQKQQNLKNVGQNKIDSTNEHRLSLSVADLPKARGLQFNNKASKKQENNHHWPTVRASKGGMILPHAHGFKAMLKQPTVRRKPAKVMKLAPLYIEARMMPPISPIDGIENMQVPQELSPVISRDPFDLYSSEIEPFDQPLVNGRLSKLHPENFLSKSQIPQSMPQYQRLNQFPVFPDFSPFPTFPYHIPIPVPMPIPMLQSTEQNSATSTPLPPLPTSGSVVTTTLRIPTLALPTFPPLTMPPAFQNLIATTKKPKQHTKKKSKRKHDSEDDSGGDDDDEDASQNVDSRRTFRERKKSRNGSQFMSNEFGGDDDDDNYNYQDDKRVVWNKSDNNDLSDDDEDLVTHRLPKYVEEEEESENSRKTETARLREPNEPWMINYNDH